MKRFAFLLAATVAFADPPKDDPCACCPGGKAPPAEIPATPEKCWEQYRRALRHKDADALWAILTKGSREALEAEGEAIRTDAKGGRKAYCEQHKLPEADVEKMTPREIVTRMVIASITPGRQKELDASKLGAVEVKGDTAKATVENGRSKDLVCFAKAGEAEGWRIDLVAMLEETKSAARKALEEAEEQGKK